MDNKLKSALKNRANTNETIKKVLIAKKSTEIENGITSVVDTKTHSNKEKSFDDKGKNDLPLRPIARTDKTQNTIQNNRPLNTQPITLTPKEPDKQNAKTVARQLSM